MSNTINTLSGKCAKSFAWKPFASATIAKGKIPFAFWESNRSKRECNSITVIEFDSEHEISSWISDLCSGAIICDSNYFWCVSVNGKFESSKSRYGGYLSA
jgi:hypothetical protein